MSADVHLTVALISGKSQHNVRVEIVGQDVITGTQKIAMVAAAADVLAGGDRKLRDAILTAAMCAAKLNRQLALTVGADVVSPAPVFSIEGE